MAGRQAALLTERDADDGDDVARQQAAANPFGGSVVTLPAQQAQADEEFQIIDDDDGDDLRTAPQHNDQRDARLTEDSGGGTYLEQQRHQQDERRQENGRSETRAQRRQRQKEGRDRTINENQALRAQIAELEARVNGIEPRIGEFDQSRARDQIAQLDREIRETDAAYLHAENALGDALTALAQGDEGARDRYMKAMRDRDQAVMKAQQLTVQKNMLSTGTVTGQQLPRPTAEVPSRDATRPPPIRPAVQARVSEFMADNPWFDPMGRDLDSRIAREIDNDVAAQGFDQGSDDYWDELDSRLREKMPWRFADEGYSQQRSQNGQARQQQSPQRRQDVQPQRRGPMVSGGSDRGAPQAGPNQVYLSRERKEALQLAGALDRDGRTVTDKAKFQRLARSYAEYDRMNGAVRT